MQDIWVAIVSGGIGAAAVSAVGAIVLACVKHKHDKEDKKIADVNALESDVNALKVAMRYLMLDRIRYLGQRYIAEGCIDFDDRRLLNEMHASYHNGLDGNGDLDVLMREVNALPLKT